MHNFLNEYNTNKREACEKLFNYKVADWEVDYLEDKMMGNLITLRMLFMMHKANPMRKMMRHLTVLKAA